MNRVRISLSFAILGALVVIASCASDVADNGDSWQVEERVLPIPPPALDRELVWHFADERVEPLMPFKRAVREGDRYRAPLVFNTAVYGQMFYDEPFNDGDFAGHPSFLGVGSPFFEDGKIHMFEQPRTEREAMAHRFGRLEVFYPFTGHLLYDEGTEARTESYPPGSVEDLPEPLADWMSQSWRRIDVVLYRPDQNLWIKLRISQKNCSTTLMGCLVDDPRFVFMDVSPRYEILESWPAASID